MADLFNRRSRALNKYYESSRCTHAETELRKRKLKGGGIQFVEQCLRCGGAQTNPIAKEKAMAHNNGVEPPPFDDELGSRYEQELQAGADKITEKYASRAEFERAEFMGWYSKYLKSPEWELVRGRVLKRARNICEGCLDRLAELAHHLSYVHVGQEFLFELVALCQECHDRIHADPPETEDDDA